MGVLQWNLGTPPERWGGMVVDWKLAGFWRAFERLPEGVGNLKWLHLYSKNNLDSSVGHLFS